MWLENGRKPRIQSGLFQLGDDIKYVRIIILGGQAEDSFCFISYACMTVNYVKISVHIHLATSGYRRFAT